MAIENYDFSIKEVLESEGGYSNDPADPGGPTNFGITIHDYRAYINHAGTPEDVRHMTVDQAKAIYKAKYWNAVDGDHLPSGVDYCVFDYGVNSGVSRANRVYSTMCARQYSHTETDVWLIDKICDERMAFLQQLRTWPVFGRGWTTRVNKVRKLSKELACHTTPTQSLPQLPKPSPTISSPPSPSKVSLISWLRTLFMAWFKGSAPTA